MGIAVLTTDTTHHTYWAWKLAEERLLDAVVIETKPPHPPFDTYHPFEAERDAYEREELLADCPAAIDGFAETLRVTTVNEPTVLARIRELRSDLIVAFGTGIIRSPLIAAVDAPLMNLHGGDPEEYRGLDCHLWAIYHGDFDALVTTLHQVDEDLDTGAIVGRRSIVLPKVLHRLRAANTQLCVALTLDALRSLQAGTLGLAPQRQRGRYYSFMPAVLKDVCLHRWEARP